MNRTGGLMDTVEKWKPISGLEEAYAVSDMGRVRSLDRVLTTRRGHTQRAKGTIIKTRPLKHSPSLVHIRDNGRTRVVRICELVAGEFVPNPKNLPYVVHVNGDIHDDRAKNLTWSALPDFKAMRDWDGLSASENRLYNIWKCMVLRCEDESRQYYYRYGGRGIKVCDEWHDFKTFVEWSYSNGYEDGLSIDRIDNDLGYCPNNCRWVTPHDQSLNKSTNVFLEVNGETLTAVEWAEITGVSRFTIYYWAREFGAQYAQQRLSEKLPHIKPKGASA